MQMRVSQWVVLGWGLGVVAACDGGNAGSEGGSLNVEEGRQVAHEGSLAGSLDGPVAGQRTPRFDASRRDDGARFGKFERVRELVHEHSLVPLDGSLLDNGSCEAAATLPDGGAVAVPTDFGLTFSCWNQSYNRRYFAVRVLPGEVVTVGTTSTDATSGQLWFSKESTCGGTLEQPAGSMDGSGVSDLCSTGSGWTYYGLALSNPGKKPIEQLISVSASFQAALPTYDLTVTRVPLAANTSCATSAPLGDGLTGESFDAASIESPETGLTRALYYHVDVPPLTRARLSLGDRSGEFYVYLRKDCAEPVWSSQNEIVNTGDEVMRAEVTVASWNQAVGGDFDLAVALSSLAPEASCETPAELAIGDSAVLEVARGGAAIVNCRCAPLERTMHAAVTVPPGTSVRVSALATIDSGATLVEMPEACSVECGWNLAFGWGESPAMLDTFNDGSEAVVRHFVVSSQGVWQEDGSQVFPAVTLSVETTPTP